MWIFSLLSLGLIVLVSWVILLVILNIRTRAVIRRYRMRPAFHVGDPAFFRTMEGVLLAPFVPGNAIQTFNGGAEIFEAMLEDIRTAEHSVCLESYIFHSGKVCRAFMDAMIDRAKKGVAVHVLLDWIGSFGLTLQDERELRAAGVKVAKYRKPHWYTLPRINNRSHRKILVVDGKVAYTGGIGIADEWREPVNEACPWAERQYRFVGPVVARIQAAFCENWLKSQAAVLEGDRYFPPLVPAGESPAQVVTSTGDGIESMRLLFLLSIGCATRSIRLLNAYFIPDAAITKALIQAKQRGVHVEILVPGDRTDLWVLREVARRSYKRLLQAGIAIFEYQPAMHHAKVLIVDDAWVSVGSANCNERSFAINDEMNVNVWDPAFAARQIADFNEDLKRAKPLTYKWWKQRPWGRKLAGYVGAFFQAQL